MAMGLTRQCVVEFILTQPHDLCAVQSPPPKFKVLGQCSLQFRIDPPNPEITQSLWLCDYTFAKASGTSFFQATPQPFLFCFMGDHILPCPATFDLRFAHIFSTSHQKLEYDRINGVA
jgi:hypothetical protein